MKRLRNRRRWAARWKLVQAERDLLALGDELARTRGRISARIAALRIMYLTDGDHRLADVLERSA